MSFDVRPTMQSSNGYGFGIQNTHRGPITFIEFAAKEEAEKAEAAVREAIKDAISVTDTNGQRW